LQSLAHCCQQAILNVLFFHADLANLEIMVYHNGEQSQ